MGEELKRQPEPIGEGIVVHDKVLELIEERVGQQEERYGTKLRINNGRDAIYDALQEAIDCVFYLTQALMERDSVNYLNENTEEEQERDHPYKREVPCYWCELENENKGLDVPPFNNAVGVAKEPFGGKYACDGHVNLLLISGWFDKLLLERPLP